MKPILSFDILTNHLQCNGKRHRIAVANATDDHTIEAIVRAVALGIAEAFLIGDSQIIERQSLTQPDIAGHIHLIHRKDPIEATREAVRMTREGEADILMKGLVNTDVLLRAILDKSNGLLVAGQTISFNAAMQIPGYHKLVFITDPAVIPSPNLLKRAQIIRYAIATTQKFGILRPKIALLHATEVVNPKIQYMQDYVNILEMWKNGEFGDVIMDGPLDVFLALDHERGSIKKVASPVLGDADILIFPNFESANIFYKALELFAGAQMAGLLQGTIRPVVLTSRSESANSKFFSIAMACILSQETLT